QRHASRLRIAALNYVAAALAEESLVQAEAATKDGLLVELVGKACPRQKAVLRRVVKPPAGIFGRKQKTSLGRDVVQAESGFQDGVAQGGVIRLGCGLERLRVSEIKTRHALILAFDQRSLKFPTQAKSDVQLSGESDVIF